MKNREFYICIGLAMGVFVCLFLALVGIDRTKEEKLNFADRPVWDLSNNDEEYWKKWSKRRNALVDKLMESKTLYSVEGQPPVLPTTAEDFLEEFYHRDYKRKLFIERLDMNEFQKVNQHFLDQFPIVSLQRRLQYEDDSRKSTQHSQRHQYDLVSATIQLHDEWNAHYFRHDHADFEAYKRPLNHQAELNRGLRHLSLAVLHREGVKAFANQINGFGYERMPEIDHFNLLKENPICVSLPEDMSKLGYTPYSLAGSEKLTDTEQLAVESLRAEYPKYMHLAFYHQFTEDTSFAPTFRQARGFDGHWLGDSINWRFDVYQSPSDPLWQVERMELVGLLKHDQPVVYVSTRLPNMKQLVDGEIRSLDQFETTALEKIYQGEFIVTEPQHDKLRMFGAIRAGKTCLECHAVKSGEMLGAFSYVIGIPKFIEKRGKPEDVTVTEQAGSKVVASQN